MANWESVLVAQRCVALRDLWKFRVWKGQHKRKVHESAFNKWYMGRTLRCSEHQSLKWTQRLVYISTKWCWVVAWNARSPVVDFTGKAGPAKFVGQRQDKWVTWSLVYSWQDSLPAPGLKHCYLLAFSKTSVIKILGNRLHSHGSVRSYLTAFLSNHYFLGVFFETHLPSAHLKASIMHPSWSPNFVVQINVFGRSDSSSSCPSPSTFPSLVCLSKNAYSGLSCAFIRRLVRTSTALLFVASPADVAAIANDGVFERWHWCWC